MNKSTRIKFPPHLFFFYTFLLIHVSSIKLNKFHNFMSLISFPCFSLLSHFTQWLEISLSISSKKFLLTTFVKTGYSDWIYICIHICCIFISTYIEICYINIYIAFDCHVNVVSTHIFPQWQNQKGRSGFFFIFITVHKNSHTFLPY